MTMERDRIKNFPDTGRSIHLSASAGSGKTRALKDRYLALLDVLDRRGLAIDQAVAITFTDKAAAEIKERVMHDLPEAMLKKIIRGRQDLRISTIHSFCMNLLKRYPFEAGLPPDFGVLDERDRASKIQRAIEDTLEELDRDPEVMNPLRGYTADELIGAVDALLALRTRLKRLEIDAGGPEGLRTRLRAGMGTGRAGEELSALLAGEHWHESLTRMELLLRTQGSFHEDCLGREHLALAAAKDARAALPMAAALGRVYFTKEGKPAKNAYIAKKYFTGADRKSYEDAYFVVQDLLARFRDLAARLAAGRESFGLLVLYQRAEERYQEQKLREGLLDFDDLEIYAYRLLRSQESPDILYWLDRKILHFLVDEFQDTSDIQWAVLERLTEELFAGQGADKAMQPTLFVVGDNKQSIYRFREANYHLIEDIRKKMLSLPDDMRDVRTLDTNYRSVPEVIGTVNRVFTKLWGEDYQPSEVERRGHRGSVRLIELLPSPEEGPPGPTEARVLAAEIRSLIEAGTVVHERAPGNDAWKQRPAGYGDCAVLIQSRTRLKDYEAALQAAGVPFRVVGGIGFYEEDEIQAVLNILFYLWNHDDRLALAAALTSPLFGLPDRDILALRTGGDMLGGLRAVHAAAAGLLDNWSRYALTEPLAGLIHRIISDTGAYLRFGRRNLQAVFNLDKLLDTAREFDRRGYTTLQDFVEWVKNIRASEQREAAADMTLPGVQGAVSIMTVHKAKGLEFPVVILPSMNQQPRSVTTGPPVIIDDRGGRLLIAAKGGGNPVYADLWEREKEELRREHQRLLYVAMTRARDHLVMIGALENKSRPFRQNSWLSSLHEAFPAADVEAGASPRLIEHVLPDGKARTIPFDQAALGETPPAEQPREHEVDMEAFIDNIAPIPPSKAPEWKRATDLLSQEKERTLEQPSPQEGKALSPLTRGSVLHRCLEEYAKNRTVDLDAVLAGFPEVLSLDQEARMRFVEEAGMVLRSITGSEDLSWIFEQRSDSYSELPFLYRKGNDIISGIIDRVVVKDGIAYIIDYKAISVANDEALQNWIDHYRPQIRVYCEAVGELFKIERIKGYLLFLDSARLALTVKI